MKGIRTAALIALVWAGLIVLAFAAGQTEYALSLLAAAGIVTAAVLRPRKP